MLTLVVLLLMSLMGMAILMNTRTELSISANTTSGRDAFTRADTASRMSTLMARLLVHEYELGAPQQVLAGGFYKGGSDDREFTVDEYDEAYFNMEKLLAESADEFDYQKRYLSAASRTDTEVDLRPHLVFRKKGKIISTARVAMDYGETANLAGMSLGTSSYDGSDGTSVRIVLAVTVNGRPPLSDDDNYGAYDSFKKKTDPDEEDALTNDVPHSVITTLFRETF